MTSPLAIQAPYVAALLQALLQGMELRWPDGRVWRVQNGHLCARHMVVPYRKTCPSATPTNPCSSVAPHEHWVETQVQFNVLVDQLSALPKDFVDSQVSAFWATLGSTDDFGRDVVKLRVGLAPLPEDPAFQEA